MFNLPQISGKDLVKALKKDGWEIIKQEGSHMKLVKYHQPVGKTTVIIPQHKIIKKGTLSRILKDSKMSLEKLKKLL
jgi:predicted RNA binding protein YcfA (HicA-like mRNA interferase family)